jgi:hypothetical protein
VLNRVRKTNNIYYQLNQTNFVKNKKNMKTKLQVYRTVMEPSLLYGSESWPARGKEISRINAAEMKYTPRILATYELLDERSLQTHLNIDST